ncbi:MAG: serine hydrolase domain-containing protein [Bacillota bacterium]
MKEQLDGLFQDLIKAKNVKHAVFSLESGDGSFRWAKAGSNGKNQEFEADIGTPFWIASVTKLFIAAAILKLQEKGQLSIYDHLAHYLPSNIVEGLLCDRRGEDYSKSLTIYHLLSHTSGLPDYLEIKPKGGKNLFDLVLEEGDRAWTIEEIVEIVKRNGKLLFPPQPIDAEKEKARYSDTNYQLLIAIIEAVANCSIDSVFKEMFYKPLCLRSTFHPGSKSLDPEPTVIPTWCREQQLDIPLAMKSFGDLNSTTGDLLRFMRALISGEAFNHPATASLMRQKWNQFGFLISPVAPGWPIEYGLGMMRYELPRIFAPFKSIPAVIGHTGANGSFLFYCKEYDFYIAGSVNQIMAAPVPFRLIPRVLKVIGSYL